MRGSLSRESVVAAARDLIAVAGVDALSLRRLAANLGVTAPALYAYVGGKGDLLRAVAEREFEALIERFAAVTEPDPVARIRGLARAYVAHARDNPQLFEVMFQFPPRLATAPVTGQEFEPATRAFELAASATADAAAAGLLRQEPLLAALTVWTAAHGAATVVQLGLFDDTDALVDSVIDAVVSGLLAGG